MTSRVSFAASLFCFQLGAVFGLCSDIATQESDCFIVRAESVTFSGGLLPNVLLRWSVETREARGVKSPDVSITVDGTNIGQESRGFQRENDERIYGPGSLRFGSAWFSVSSVDTTATLSLRSPDRPECEVTLQLGPFVRPELSDTDLRTLTEAAAIMESRDAAIKAGGEGDSVRHVPPEIVEQVMFRPVDGAYRGALEVKDPLIKSELFRSLLYYHFGFWDDSGLARLSLQTNEAHAKAQRQGASAALFDWLRLLKDSSDRHLQCSVAIKLSIDLARYGQYAGSLNSDVSSFIKSSCEEFPVSRSMEETIRRCVDGSLRRGVYGWFTRPGSDTTVPGEIE